MSVNHDSGRRVDPSTEKKPSSEERAFERLRVNPEQTLWGSSTEWPQSTVKKSETPR